MRIHATTGGPRWRDAIAACLAVLLLAGGCSLLHATKAPPRSADVFVLLPDDRGKTGAIVVTGPDGNELLLSKTRQTVAISPGTGAGTPYILPRRDLRTLVGPALESLPPRPKTFLFYFVRDDAVLTPASRAEIGEALRAIRDHRPVEISIVGHTDTVGTRRYNRELGLKRARAVAEQVVSAGIDPSILEISSHGEGNPIVQTGDEVPEPRNRRVELTVR
ncbi:MAG: hypothetical protein Kow00128_17750 [Deltaproteobacteria bacterium]